MPGQAYQVAMICDTSNYRGHNSRKQEVFAPRTGPHERGSNFFFDTFAGMMIALPVLYVLGVGPAWRLACYHQGFVASHILDLYAPLDRVSGHSYALDPLVERYLALWGVVSGVNY
jgi:hypothetical protein